MKTVAQIIVAGGRGQRAGGNIPKQYQNIDNISIVYKTLSKLLKVFESENKSHFSLLGPQIVVYAKGDDEFLSGAIESHVVQRVVGGSSRTASVRAGLDALRNTPPDYVMIHDAARPFVSTDTLTAVLRALDSHQGAVPTLPIADAVKTFDKNILGDDVERATLRRVQTPQAFRYRDILEAYDALPTDLALSDDVAVARRAGLHLTCVEGDPENFKITYPSDFEKARAYVRETSMGNETTLYTATGLGYDVHRYTDGDGIWLCGVKIPAPYTLLGHSDADAGLHALTDAIFGALADGDIGDHFPPTDAKWKGASSDQFLKFAVEKVSARGGSLKHVDVTLICEKPKVKPHRNAMREKIAELTGLPLSRVSVKATTTERLGFTGREEGLAAQAVATLVLPE